MILTSPLLPVPHGFPTRLGGVSQGPYSSLNCALKTEDDPAAVAQNHELLAKQAGVAVSQLRTAVQVHGIDLLEATAAVPAVRPDADAVWTELAGLAVGVRTADCIPVLIADVRQKRVAAAHAGWRGVIGNITVKTIQALQGRGSQLSDIRVAIGPAIQKCCFEVDGDLPSRFAAAFGPDVVVSVEGKQKKHLDLSLAVQRSLQAHGLAEAQIHVLPECTHCDSRFFSHRRDHGVTGRHLSFISHAF